MRDIKFRAWDKKERFDMADVALIDTAGRYIVVADGFQWNIDKETGEADCVAQFDEIELMQYAGFKDKSGRDIYEEDILQDPYGQMAVCKYANMSPAAISGFFMKMLNIKAGFAAFEESWLNTQVEVVGNTYENPELLKKESV